MGNKTFYGDGLIYFFQNSGCPISSNTAEDCDVTTVFTCTCVHTLIPTCVLVHIPFLVNLLLTRT